MTTPTSESHEWIDSQDSTHRASVISILRLFVTPVRTATANTVRTIRKAMQIYTHTYVPYIRYCKHRMYGNDHAQYRTTMNNEDMDTYTPYVPYLHKMTILTASLCMRITLCTAKAYYGTYSIKDMDTYVCTIHKMAVSVQYLRQRRYGNIHTIHE